MAKKVSDMSDQEVGHILGIAIGAMKDPAPLKRTTKLVRQLINKAFEEGRDYEIHHSSVRRD